MYNTGIIYQLLLGFLEQDTVNMQFDTDTSSW